MRKKTNSRRTVFTCMHHVCIFKDIDSEVNMNIKPTITGYTATQTIDGKTYRAEGKTFSEAFVGCLTKVKEAEPVEESIADNMMTIKEAADAIIKGDADRKIAQKNSDAFWDELRKRVALARGIQ